MGRCFLAKSNHYEEIIVCRVLEQYRVHRKINHPLNFALSMAFWKAPQPTIDQVKTSKKQAKDMIGASVKFV